MRPVDRREPFRELWLPGRNFSYRQIDAQNHVFAGGGDIVVLDVDERVEEVKPLRIKAQHLRRDAHLVIDITSFT